MCSLCRILMLMLVLSRSTSIMALASLDRGKFPRATAPEPKPCKSGVVCDDQDDYPTMVVEKMIKDNINLMEASPNLQQVEETDNSTGQIRAICESRRKWILIRKAQNKDGVWRHVLNDGRQYYYVELCRDPDTPCNFSQYFPAGYTSFCRQRHARVRLAAVVGDGVVQDEFLIPSCCNCYLNRPLSSELTRRITTNEVT